MNCGCGVPNGTSKAFHVRSDHNCRHHWSHHCWFCAGRLELTDYLVRVSLFESWHGSFAPTDRPLQYPKMEAQR